MNKLSAVEINDLRIAADKLAMMGETDLAAKLHALLDAYKNVARRPYSQDAR